MNDDPQFLTREGTCPWCHGELWYASPGACTCFLGHAPCSACESTYLVCRSCGFEPSEEEKVKESEHKNSDHIWDAVKAVCGR